VIGLVLSCEHASWTLPPDVDLGVPLDVLRSQASWDPGAFDIAAQLGERFGLPIHTGAFSRMWVDLNRPRDHVDVVPQVSFGARVPGNAATVLTGAVRAARIATYHQPYWDAVRRDVAGRLRSIGGCLHLSSHSFDPGLGADRDFDVGVLYDPAVEFEADLAERLQFKLRGGGLAVRANLPYRGTEPALVTSLRQVFAGQRYAGLELETSHAVVRSPDGCARIARATATALDDLLS